MRLLLFDVLDHVTILSYYLSSYDEYLTEVRSLRLEWSPVHSSDKFWVSMGVWQWVWHYLYLSSERECDEVE